MLHHAQHPKRTGRVRTRVAIGDARRVFDQPIDTQCAEALSALRGVPILIRDKKALSLSLRKPRRRYFFMLPFPSGSRISNNRLGVLTPSGMSGKVGLKTSAAQVEQL